MILVSLGRHQGQDRGPGRSPGLALRPPWQHASHQYHPPSGPASWSWPGGRWND